MNKNTDRRYEIIKSSNKPLIIIISAVWILGSTLLYFLVGWVILGFLFFGILYLPWMLHFRNLYEKLVLEGKKEDLIKREIVKERSALSPYILSIFFVFFGLLISIPTYGMIGLLFNLGLLFIVIGILALVFRKII